MTRRLLNPAMDPWWFGHEDRGRTGPVEQRYRGQTNRNLKRWKEEPIPEEVEEDGEE